MNMGSGRDIRSANILRKNVEILSNPDKELFFILVI